MRYSITKRGATLSIGRFLLGVQLNAWELGFRKGMWTCCLKLGPFFLIWMPTKATI